MQINIFDDRLEISNPGGLVSVLIEKDFGKRSITRNPLIFSLLKLVALVEKVGSGISRMRNAMLEAGLSEPEFDFSDFFVVTFKRPEADYNVRTQRIKQRAGISAEEIRNKCGKDI
ncbi:ATP-binding protein [Melioribacter sp. Ez-97]|uniref:ATP-binding protein n=1 Tax=Melioribacter sp. Ez-97 TaxID=3423434 RepID=UPI003EDABB38